MLDVVKPYKCVNIDCNEPDSDAIQMFCGQIPRIMCENELRSIFENYGQIYKLNILRDKKTGESKGCCFLTYYKRKSALDAQNALHNLVTLPGMQNPIQMKPANIENRNQRKIFIGMISKLCNENDIKQLFLPFGKIEECTVLRDINNRSRGCAFVTYLNRQSAFNAINKMHHSCVMNGCSSPINVRFADTPKHKQIRRIQQKLNANNVLLEKTQNSNSLDLILLNQFCSNVATQMNSENKSLYQVQNDLSCGDHKHVSLKTSHNPCKKSTTFLNEWQSIHGLEYYSPLMTNTIPSINSITEECSIHNQGQNMNNKQHIISDKDFISPSTNSRIRTDTSSNMWINSSDDDFRLLDGFLPSIPHLSYHNNEISQTILNVTKQHNHNNNSHTIKKRNEKQIVGPIGSNLFIYHLPSEFTDHDLAQTFSPFGNILSAKVFIDKMTNRSKCFGFVSYDNVYSAHQAIKCLNGFQIGFKRLKVQLKTFHF